jgi:hypothetical protein
MRRARRLYKKWIGFNDLLRVVDLRQDVGLLGVPPSVAPATYSPTVGLLSGSSLPCPIFMLV